MDLGMDMEIRLVSKKLITPSSSPCPNHPNLKLSSLDQLSSPVHFSIIFYYNNFPKAQGVQMLEKSLGDTLSVFYPLAGTYMPESFSIECNDRGVEFWEARVDGCLKTLLLEHKVDAKLVSGLVPPPPLQHSPLLSVQASLFECGGIAVGFTVSHIVGDMHALTSFCNAWAAACKSSASQLVPPPSLSFNMASMFPPREDMPAPRPFAPPREDSSLDIVTTRFVFHEEALSRLKKKRGSRVQVVTALIWRVLIEIDAARHGRSRSSMVSHVFNARGKPSNIPIPDKSFGNLWWTILARFTPKSNSNSNSNGQQVVELRELVGVVRDALESGRSSVQVCGDYDQVFKVARKAWGEVRDSTNVWDVDWACDFSSWCRMGHYEVDFGWGKPIWVSSHHIPFDGLVIFLDSKDGDGIEAWLSLRQDKMLLFHHHPDILAFAA